MLNARAKGEDAFKILAGFEKEYKRLFLEEREEYGDLIGDCRKIFTNYCDAYKDDGMEVISSEQTIQLPLLPGRAIFQGTVDRVYLEKKAKRRWLSDSKSHKNIPGEENRFHDIQTVLYLWAWNLINPRRRVDGIMWDYLRTKLPVEPEVLQSGKLSQRANIDTTYAVASRCVAEHCKRTGEDPTRYAEWLEGLKGRENKFLQRVFLPNPPKQLIEQLIAEMKETTNEILDRGEFDHSRNLTKDCSWCEFRDLCHAELRGHDADFIRKTEFVIDKELRDEHAEED